MSCTLTTWIFFWLLLLSLSNCNNNLGTFRDVFTFFGWSHTGHFSLIAGLECRFWELCVLLGDNFPLCTFLMLANLCCLSDSWRKSWWYCFTGLLRHMADLNNFWLVHLKTTAWLQSLSLSLAVYDKTSNPNEKRHFISFPPQSPIDPSKFRNQNPHHSFS